MPLHRFKRPRAEHPFVGLWHITSMEVCDNDYVNMERQAFVEINSENLGSFQFGLVRGELDGYVERRDDEPSDSRRDLKQPASDRFMFTWDGFDEGDEVSGSGWMRVTGANEAVGLIKLHLGDRSTFRARRARARRGG